MKQRNNDPKPKFIMYTGKGEDKYEGWRFRTITAETFECFRSHEFADDEINHKWWEVYPSEGTAWFTGWAMLSPQGDQYTFIFYADGDKELIHQKTHELFKTFRNQMQGVDVLDKGTECFESLMTSTA